MKEKGGRKEGEGKKQTRREQRTKNVFLSRLFLSSSPSVVRTFKQERLEIYLNQLPQLGSKEKRRNWHLTLKVTLELPITVFTPYNSSNKNG